MRYFEYTNSIGQIFRAKYNTPEEQSKAWFKMFNYYNSDERLHPLWEYLDLDDEKWNEVYERANAKHLPSIKKCLKYMWQNNGLSSFYGKVINETQK